MQVCSRRFLTGQAAGGWDVPVRQTETSERRQLQEVLIVQQEAQAIPYQQLPVSLRVSLHGFLPSTLPYLFTALFVPYRVRERERMDGTRLQMVFGIHLSGGNRLDLNRTGKSRADLLRQALLFRRLASYTCRWMGWRGCSSTTKALRRAFLFLPAELMLRTEHRQ